MEPRRVAWWQVLLVAAAAFLGFAFARVAIEAQRECVEQLRMHGVEYPSWFLPQR